MSERGKYKIKSLVFEETQEDGTVVDTELSTLDWDLGHIRFMHHPSFPNQRFWLATDHAGLTTGNHAIATAVPGEELDPDTAKDRTNTLIGLIRDRACGVFAIYTLPDLSTLP
jgi:hypothetical protein